MLLNTFYLWKEEYMLGLVKLLLGLSENTINIYYSVASYARDIRDNSFFLQYPCSSVALL
jgi:hypothetical protein